MTGSARAKLQLALLLAAALALRLAAGLVWQARLPQGHRFGFGDSESYWQLGLAIARGAPYQYGSPDRRVFRMPGYPLLLAGLFCCSGPNVGAARALSAVLSTLAVGGVYCLAKGLFDRPTGRLAALMAGLYPGAIAMGGLILSEAPFCAAMLLQLVLWQSTCRNGSRPAARWRLFASGLAGGLATLIRPSWLFFTPLAIAVDALATRRWRRPAESGLWVLAGLVLAMLPWWIRNALLTGRFVPTTLQVGASLYDGLHPGASGASDWQAVELKAAELKVRLKNQAQPGQPPIEYRLDRALRQEALGWAAHHPWQASGLAWTKFSRMWNLWPNEPAFRSLPVRLMVAASYLPVLALGLAGAWRFAQRGWPYAHCLLPAVYLSLVHMVFVGSIRYRQPAMLTLIVLAAGFVCQRVGCARATPIQATASG